MPVKKVAAVAALTLLMAGCQTTNPYTGEQEVNKTSKYAGVGAVAGAIIGGIADGSKGALKGAAIGGVAGSGYGYYIDQQEARLRAELKNTGVQVKRHGDNLQLIMPSNITFDTNKADIKASFYRVLGSVATVFKEFDKNLIQVIGHTDNTGSDKINLPLSKRRADSVAGYLVGQGIPSSRITAYGKGSSEPVTSNKTSAGRAANRRVEIDILPKPQ